MEKENVNDALISEALGFENPFTDPPEPMTMATANSVVKGAAREAVVRYLSLHGAEGADGDLGLNEVFDAAMKNEKKTWTVEGYVLNRTQIQALLVSQIADGELLKGLLSIPGMPNRLTINRWREEDPSFAAWMIRAEAAQGDLFMETTIDIANGATPKTSFVAKLQIDQHTKVAGFLNAKRWTPRHQVDVRLEEEVDVHHLRSRLESVLLANTERYRQMFGIVMVREDQLAEFVLKQADALKAQGVEVLKTADYVDTTISADMFRVNERTPRE